MLMRSSAQAPGEFPPGAQVGRRPAVAPTWLLVGIAPTALRCVSALQSSGGSGAQDVTCEGQPPSAGTGNALLPVVMTTKPLS